ncbi:MAG: aminotransferase class V-fold PLP-dependent enzyme, partial [Acidimicrobiales bacterium]|nr:aminotransferase class V-fold PLP-dependent enzyme [Acidimicrobiales bacterium]
MTSPDLSGLKKDFPILHTERHGRPLTFLDSAASSQRPTQVLDAMNYTYTHAYANVHRGVYGLAEAATNAYETARLKVARFIAAPDSSEILFTKNATESLNLVAGSWGRANLGPGDAIVLTTMEHHANIVPWQMLQAEKGFEIRWIHLGEDGKLDLGDLDRLLDGAKLLSVTSMSNVLGTITPLDQLISAAHAAGALVCV